MRTPSIPLALVLALGLAGCDESAASPQATPPPPEASCLTLEAHDLPWAPMRLAQTAASREVEVRARVAGMILERAFVEGAHVQEGDVLFRIDARPFEAALQAAEARVAEAVARVEEAERGVARKQQLVASQSVAQRELDDALTARALALAQRSLAEAELTQAKLDLEYTTVRAPLAGRVGKAVLEAGNMVDSFRNPIMTVIAALDPIYVSYRISERERVAWQQALSSGKLSMPAGEPSLRVAIELIDGTPYPHEGTLNFHGVEIDPATGTAEIRAELPNPDELLLPGQFVRARLLGVVRGGTLTVPQRAVQMGPTSAFVYVLGADDTIAVRDVELSAWEGGDWVVEHGLAPGERVVVDNLLKLRPGAKVKPIPWAPPALADADAGSAR